MGFAQLLIAGEHAVILRFTDLRDDVLAELEKQLFGAASSASPERRLKIANDGMSVQRAYSPYRSLSGLKPSTFPIVGKVLPSKKKKSSVARFKYTRKASLIRRPFQPIVLGEIRALPHGQTEICLRQRLNILPRVLVNAIIALGIGGLVGSLTASLLMPDYMSTFAIVALALIVPLLIGVGAVLITRYIVYEDQPGLFDALSIGFKNCRIQSTEEMDLPPDNSLIYSLVSSLGVGLSIICFSYVLHSHVLALWKQGRYRDVETLSRQILTVRQSFLGEHHLAVITSKFDTADCLRTEGEFAQAKQLYEEALVGYNADPNAHQSNAILTVFNIGRCYEALGQLKQAEDSYTKVISMITSMTAGANSNTMWMARIRDRLGMVLMKEKKFTEALAEEQKALDIDLAHGDAGGRAVGQDYNDMGVLEYKLNKLDQAVTHFNKALDAKKDDGRVRPYSVGVSQLNLGKVYAKKNMAEQAKNQRVEALQSWSTYLGQPVEDPNQAYQLILDRNKPDYESEHIDNRSEALIDGPSRM